MIFSSDPIRPGRTGRALPTSSFPSCPFLPEPTPSADADSRKGAALRSARDLESPHPPARWRSRRHRRRGPAPQSGHQLRDSGHPRRNDVSPSLSFPPRGSPAGPTDRVRSRHQPRAQHPGGGVARGRRESERRNRHRSRSAGAVRRDDRQGIRAPRRDDRTSPRVRRTAGRRGGKADRAVDVDRSWTKR